MRVCTLPCDILTGLVYRGLSDALCCICTERLFSPLVVGIFKLRFILYIFYFCNIAAVFKLCDIVYGVGMSVVLVVAVGESYRKSAVTVNHLRTCGCFSVVHHRNGIFYKLRVFIGSIRNGVPFHYFPLLHGKGIIEEYPVFIGDVSCLFAEFDFALISV